MTGFGATMTPRKPLNFHTSFGPLVDVSKYHSILLWKQTLRVIPFGSPKKIPSWDEIHGRYHGIVNINHEISPWMNIIPVQNNGVHTHIYIYSACIYVHIYILLLLLLLLYI